MLSQTGLYAMQVAMFLAGQPSGTAVSASAIAEHLSLPATYLAKVLTRMRQEGTLVSRRGLNGGFRLSKKPEALTVEEIVGPFEEIRPLKTCLLGGPCDTEAPCTAHAHRVRWNNARRDLLRETTLAELLDGG